MRYDDEDTGTTCEIDCIESSTCTLLGDEGWDAICEASECSCSGGVCDLRCDASSCESAGTRLTCRAGSHCVQDCAVACSTTCVASECEQSCLPPPEGSSASPTATCWMACGPGSTCSLDCEASEHDRCFLCCEEGSTCDLRCPDDGPLTCPDGKLACSDDACELPCPDAEATQGI
jgi:hypothetical protein